MTPPLLTCAAVHKRFGSTRAVDGVSLELERGRILALLGPSGCGKTTLLRLIAGFETPDAGEIVVAGRILNGPTRFVPPDQRRVAMVFQEFALFPHLDVAANVAFGLSGSSEKPARVARLLDLVALDGLATRMPHQLSGGQQQRVALARALASDPELILLDEPFSNLDPTTRQRVRAEVKQLIRSVGITAVFVTHDQEEALSLAEQVGVMVDGRLLQIGAPGDVYARPISRAVAGFIGDANFIPGQVRDGVVVCELGRFPADPALAGPVEIMLRAESVVLDAQGFPGVVHSVEYFGYGQVLTVRLDSGLLLRVRLLAAAPAAEGQRVGLAVSGELVLFPVV